MDKQNILKGALIGASLILGGMNAYSANVDTSTKSTHSQYQQLAYYYYYGPYRPYYHHYHHVWYGGPGYYVVPNHRCFWIRGHRNRWGNWIPAHRVCR